MKRTTDQYNNLQRAMAKTNKLKQAKRVLSSVKGKAYAAYLTEAYPDTLTTYRPGPIVKQGAHLPTSVQIQPEDTVVQQETGVVEAVNNITE